MASAARFRSGKSQRGSAPRRTRVSIFPATAAWSISVVPRPCSLGTSVHFCRRAWLGLSILTRPGRKPGARPMSRAPRTFPLRNAGRKVACGSSALITAATEIAGSADSAIEARPKMVTTEPSRSCCASGSPLVSKSVRVFAASPAWQRIECWAYDSLPVAVGPIWTTLVRPLVAAPRRRRCNIASSSLRSGPTISTVSASHASAIVAGGSPKTSSAGRPSSSCASMLSVPITERAIFDQAYASSLVNRDPPMMPTPCGPAWPMASAAAASAEPQSVPSNCLWLSWSRTSGMVRRSSLLTASKLNRPLSHSQPWFTDSTSTPR